MQSFFTWSAIVFVLLIAQWWCLIHYRASRTRLNSNEAQSDSGLLLISIADLLVPVTGVATLIVPFPTELQCFIKNYTSVQLSKALLEYKTDDAKRAITIAAVLNQFHIPLELIKIDGRTKELWLTLAAEQALTRISKEDFLRTTNAFKELGIHNSHTDYDYILQYYNHLVLIGALMIRHASKSNYPSIENFVAIFSQHFKPHQHIPNINETKSIITAWAALTDSPIPHSYKQLDVLAAALICFELRKPIIKTKTKLTIVQ